MTLAKRISIDLFYPIPTGAGAKSEYLQVDQFDCDEHYSSDRYWPYRISLWFRVRNKIHQAPDSQRLVEYSWEWCSLVTLPSIVGKCVTSQRVILVGKRIFAIRYIYAQNILRHTVAGRAAGRFGALIWEHK